MVAFPVANRDLFGCDELGFFDLETESFCDATAVFGICLGKVGDLQALNSLGHGLHATDDVVDEVGAGLWRHKPVEIARLTVVFVPLAMVIACSIAVDGVWNILVTMIFL